MSSKTRDLWAISKEFLRKGHILQIVTFSLQAFKHSLQKNSRVTNEKMLRATALAYSFWESNSDTLVKKMTPWAPRALKASFAQLVISLCLSFGLDQWIPHSASFLIGMARSAYISIHTACYSGSILATPLFGADLWIFPFVICSADFYFLGNG